MRAVNVNHGNFNAVEYVVDITAKMRDRALAFACKIKLDDNQYRRLLPANLRNVTAENVVDVLKVEIQRTYVGKLGELAFSSLLHDSGKECHVRDMFTIFAGQNNVDSYDFVTVDNRKIDIKTGFRSNHKRLMVNEQQFEGSPKDIYVGVRLNAQDVPGHDKLILWDSVESAVVYGYVFHSDLARVEYRNFGEGRAKSIPYNRLRGIDEVLNLCPDSPQS